MEELIDVMAKRRIALKKLEVKHRIINDREKTSTFRIFI
jgi:hypothetical protein